MTSFTLSAMPIVFFAGLVAPLADKDDDYEACAGGQ